MELRSEAKSYIRRALVGSRVLDLAGRFAIPGAVILMYHSVRKDPREFADVISPGISHAASIFRRQMEIVAREFAPVTLQDILRFLSGQAGLPRRAVAITFDDGFADNLEVAEPILSHFGIRGAFYPMVDLIGTTSPPWYCRLRHSFLNARKTEWASAPDAKVWSLKDRPSREAALLAAFDLCAPLVSNQQEKAISEIELILDVESRIDSQPFMMDWDQLRRLNAKGHIVGSHTLTHPNCAYVRDEMDLRTELTESKKRIEEKLGAEVEHFSYPHPALNPQWSDRTLKMTASAGYRSAVTTTGGLVSGGSNPLCLNRFGAPRTEDRFRWILSRAFLRF